MDSNSDSDYIGSTTKNTTNKMLPAKSKLFYEKAYTNFMNWCESRNEKQYNENVLLTYFSFISKKYRASSLWSYYSKLKSTMIINKNVDIGKFPQLLAFLKTKSDGYVPSKPKTLNGEQIQRFVEEAPDDIYLVVKVSF